MKHLIIFLLLLATGGVYAQDAYRAEIEKYQQELNEEFKDKEASPLTKKDRRKFKGHQFFPVGRNYRVEAEFVRADDPATFFMKTSTNRLPKYDKYGVAKFTLNGKQYQLTIYQSHRIRQIPIYRDQLFLPFTDLTNGEETYGGGRYIDLKVPKGDKIIIDFNKAYSPSCAYDHDYSCPIPPAENDLDVRVEAGLKNLEL